MVKEVFVKFFKNKKGQEEDSSELYSWLIKILLIMVVAIALYFMIKGTGNAALPK